MKTKKAETKRSWQRETTIRDMVCVVCGNMIPSRSNILVAHFRGNITLCNECEKLLTPRLKIYEDAVINYLPHHYRDLKL